MPAATSSSRSLLHLALGLLAACGGGDGPSGPGGGGSGPMSATVNGQGWTANAGTVAVGTSGAIPGLYTISGSQVSGGNARAISISLMNIPGPGTYPLGTGAHVSGGTAIYAESAGGWGTPLSGEAGSITLSTLTATRIAGTFTFVADAVTGGAVGTRSVTAGQFDVPITTAVATASVPETSMNRIGATIGGASFVASTVALQSMPATLFGFTSGNTRYTLSVTVQSMPGPGTYAIGAGQPARISVGGKCVEGGAQDCAWSSTSGGTGTVTVTTMAGGRATGTFTGTIPLAAGSGAATLSVTGGTFDIGVP